MKTSAGLLVWRRAGPGAGSAAGIEVLLAHPGGPFFSRRDDGSWSIPKGEYDEGVEDPLAAALREFAEEIGQPAPVGEYVPLGSHAQDRRKTNTMWAVEGDLDVTVVTSNLFEMSWPPGTGRKQSFPEVDRADWFGLERAAGKIFASQRVFLQRLAALVVAEAE